MVAILAGDCGADTIDAVEEAVRWYQLEEAESGMTGSCEVEAEPGSKWAQVCPLQALCNIAYLTPMYALS